MSRAPTVVFFPEAAFGPALNCVGIAQACRDTGSVRSSAGRAGRSQGPSRRGALTLRTERLGPLPVVNHFPTRDRRVGCPYASSLGVLLRSIIVEREPI